MTINDRLIYSLTQNPWLTLSLMFFLFSLFCFSFMLFFFRFLSCSSWNSLQWGIFRFHTADHQIQNPEFHGCFHFLVWEAQTNSDAVFSIQSYVPSVRSVLLCHEEHVAKCTNVVNIWWQTWWNKWAILKWAQKLVNKIDIRILVRFC